MTTRQDGQRAQHRGGRRVSKGCTGRAERRARKGRTCILRIGNNRYNRVWRKGRKKRKGRSRRIVCDRHRRSERRLNVISPSSPATASPLAAISGPLRYYGGKTTPTTIFTIYLTFKIITYFYEC